MRRDGFSDCNDFKQRLVIRFSESIDEEPETKLFRIRQTGTVAEYVSEFEDLSAHVPDLEDHHLEHIFYNGLSTEMKEVIRMKDPQGLSNFIAAVLRWKLVIFSKWWVKQRSHQIKAIVLGANQRRNLRLVFITIQRVKISRRVFWWM